MDMATQNLKASLVIDAETRGRGEIEELVGTLESMSGVLADDIGASAQQAAQKLRELGNQEQVIASFLAIQDQVSASQRALNQLNKEVNSYAAQIAASGPPTAQEVAHLEKLRAAAAATSTTLDQQKAQLAETAAAMQRHGIATDQARQALTRIDGEVRNTLRSVGELDPHLKQAIQGWQGMGDAADQAAGKVGQTRKGLQSISTQLDAMQKKMASTFKDLAISMGGVFGAAKLQQFATDAIAIADAYGQMAERIQMATPAAGEYAMVQERILETANLTYRPLQEQQELYIRTAEALRSLSYSTSEALDITDSFSYLLTTNAASHERAASAVSAYSKAIQTGKVDADSWQSIMAATPTIVDAIAQATGKSAAAIRQMGVTGNLALRDLNEGLRQSVEVNKQAASQMSASVNDAVTRLANTWQVYVGQANQASGATQDIAGYIDLLSDNLDTVVNAALRAGQVMVAVWGVKALQGLAAYTMALLGAQRQTAALGVQSAASAAQAGGAWTAAAARVSLAWSAASKTALAAWAGWEIGTFLREEFVEVEQAGIALAAGLTKVAARAQSAWEMIKAAFTDDTIAAAQERLRIELERIDDEYAALFASAGKAGEAQKKQGEAAEAAAAGTQKLTGTLGEAQTKAAELVREFHTLRDGSEGVEGALKKLSEALKFDNAGSVASFAMALDELASKGEVTAKQVGDAWQQALSKLSVDEIGKLRGSIEDMGRQGVLTAQQVAQANEQILAASFEKVGVNAAQAMGKISDGAQQAIDGIGLVAEAAKTAGASVEQSARAIEMAFVAAIPKADSLEAISELEKRLKLMGEAGQIGADGIERVKAALDKQKATIESQIPGIQSVEEALRQLGVKPQAELDALAKSAQAAFDVVKASGTATPREINEAWKAMAEASIAANNGVANATIEAQAAQHGFVVEVDKAGKAIVKSMTEAADATKDVGDAAKQAGEDAAEGAAAAEQATDRFVKNAQGQILKYTGSWMDAEAAASSYASQVAAMVYDINKPIEEMTRQHSAMVRSLESLDAAQKRLQSGGANSVEDLRLRLLELNGTEEQIAEARQRREIAEVDRQKRLMQLQLQKARTLGNDEEAAALAYELTMLDQQLKLLEQIHREEDKQRKAAAAEAKRQQRQQEREAQEREQAQQQEQTPTRQRTPTQQTTIPTPGVVGGPVNITVNANGINDPQKLARLIEPELARLGRLAR